VEDPQDEAGLLYRAKRLAAREPAAALALLAVHARHFADGALAQERDVLTIRLLRRLGRRVLADWLAAEFRARYPHSVYLPSTEP
jgi:hypothetical protein